MSLPKRLALNGSPILESIPVSIRLDQSLLAVGDGSLLKFSKKEIYGSFPYFCCLHCSSNAWTVDSIMR